MRVGSGHDTHRLVEGRPLILGGVRVPHSRGLSGHSDADVVLHAVTDALLGAAGLGDIGDLFPDTDPANKDADSTRFVAESVRRLNLNGWQPVNLDVTIFAQEPKLGPVKGAIRDNIARLLGLPADAVNVKAKTGEHVGHIGRGEAIGCHAAVLIQRDDRSQSPLPPALRGERGRSEGGKASAPGGQPTSAATRNPPHPDPLPPKRGEKE